MKKICVFIIVGIVLTLAAIASEPYVGRAKLIEVRGDEYSYNLKSNDLAEILHRLGIDSMGKLVEADISILNRKLLQIVAYVKNREVTEMNRYSTTRLDTEKASKLAKTLVLLAKRHPAEREINPEVILKHFKLIEITGKSLGADPPGEKHPNNIQSGLDKSYKDPKINKLSPGNWHRLREIPYEKEIRLYRLEGNIYELDFTLLRRMLMDAKIKGPFTFELRVEKDDGRLSAFLPYGGDAYHEGRMDLELKDKKNSEGRKTFLFESPGQIPDRILLPDPLELDWFQKPHHIIFKNEKGEVQASIPVSVVRGPMSNELR